MTQLVRAAFVVVLTTFLMGSAFADESDLGVAAYEAGDYVRALEQLRPLAEAGDAVAQYYVGAMYGRGVGVDRDSVAAVYWFNPHSPSNVPISAL